MALTHQIIENYIENRYASAVNKKHPKTNALSKYIQFLPFASFAVSILRHAMITLAPNLAKALAVSLPMPLLAPVTITVLPSILFCGPTNNI
jgi:hypothetical protein